MTEEKSTTYYLVAISEIVLCWTIVLALVVGTLRIAGVI